MSDAENPAWSAVVIHPDDDVAVALCACEPGELRFRVGGRTEGMVLREAVPLGHKAALRDLVAGAPVRKFGEIIGEASVAIARGAHVHVHNLKSRRARRDETAPTAQDAGRMTGPGRRS